MNSNVPERYGKKESKIDYEIHICYDMHIKMRRGYTMLKQEESCGDICPCREVCPLSEALAMLSGKWKMRILCGLIADGTLRYSEIQKRVSGITPAVLSSSLKELETDGLITRNYYSEIPVRVEYALTVRGKELWPILHSLAHWSLREPLSESDLME